MISWVADHRKHHAYSDRLGDPHSPHVDHGGGWRGALRGLAHAHVGWLFDHTQRGARERFAPDLLADPVISFVDRTFVLWSLVGLAIPFGLGVLIGGTVARGPRGDAVGRRGAHLRAAPRHLQHQLAVPLLRPPALCHRATTRATCAGSRRSRSARPGTTTTTPSRRRPFHGMGRCELDLSGDRDLGAGALRAWCGTCSGSAPTGRPRRRSPGEPSGRPLRARRRRRGDHWRDERCDAHGGTRQALPSSATHAAALDADARGGAVARRIRALARAPPRRADRGPAGRDLGARRAGLLLAGLGLARARRCPCCSTSPRAGRGGTRPARCAASRACGRSSSVAARDPDVDLAVDVAAGGRADVLAGVGAAGPRDGGQRLLADRAARPRARGPRPARAAGEDRPARRARAARPSTRRRPSCGASSATCTTARRRGWWR